MQQFISSIVERSKSHVKWIFASRSSAGLPIGSWLAYGTSGLAIDDIDLRFSVDEAQEIALGIAPSVEKALIAELLHLTDGWPTALTFALHSASRGESNPLASTLTKDLLYRYFAEQVVGSLNDDARDFLFAASLLPEIEVSIMEAAGFRRSIAMLEDLKAHGTFVAEVRPGVFRLHDLFREHVRHEAQRRGHDAALAPTARVAEVLVRDRRFDLAIPLLAGANLMTDIEAIILNEGLDLLSHGFVDLVRTALGVLPSASFSDAMRGLEGMVLLAEGKESAGERAIARALGGSVPPSIRHALLFRLVTYYSHQGSEQIGLLESLIADESAPIEVVLEAKSLLAFAFVRTDHIVDARALVDEIRAEIASREKDLSDETLAKLLLRIGNTAVFLKDFNFSSDTLQHAAELAERIGLWSVASRAHRSLVIIERAQTGRSDVLTFHAKQSALAAEKSGDFRDLQFGLLLLLSRYTQEGNEEEAERVERRAIDLGNMDFIAQYIHTAQGQRHIWHERYGEAYRSLTLAHGKQPHAVDRALVSSARYLAAAMLHADDAAERAAALASISECDGFAVGTGVAQLILIAGDIVRGRFATAHRLLDSVDRSHEALHALACICQELLRFAEMPDYEGRSIVEDLDRAEAAGFAGVARYLEIVLRSLQHRRTSPVEVNLTPTELRILRALQRGDAPKQIAADLSRSVLTINAHIQNISKKLGTHTRNDTLAVARRRGFIEAPPEPADLGAYKKRTQGG